VAKSSPVITVEPDPALVRAELDRILSSEVFLRSERLSAFLRFIVQASLNGDGATLKEHVIAVELYGKGADFDTAADPIVRVDARRLRDKLREYYASAPPGQVIISVPKGSYTPAFEPGVSTIGTSDPGAHRDKESVSAQVPSTGAHHRLWRRWAVVTAAAALAAVTLLIGTSMTRSRTPASRLLTVTSFPGAEDDPALSPDGNFIAFNWPGAEGGLSDDLWVTAVEGGGLRRLTTTPDTYDKWPQWSPDGRLIAYTRYGPERPTVAVISPLGGEERTLGDGSSPGWTPDSRALVMAVGNPVNGLVHHTLATGARRQLTAAPIEYSEFKPRVSPDGTMVSFQRWGAGRSAIFVVPTSGGEPRVVVDWVSGIVGGHAWMPDGREIIYGRPETSGRYLVRTTVDGATSSQVSGVPFGSLSPTLARAQGGHVRLGFVSGQVDIGLRLMDLGSAAASQTVDDRVFADATRMDKPGRFSPDGHHIAFVSDRNGSQQVWIAARDGSGLRSLTQLEHATINFGSFSPDGRSAVFDATLGGATDLYSVRLDGSGVTRLTEGSAVAIDPEWSKDGAWIYYSSTASGTHAIWKLPAAGGTPIQITTETGFEPREAPDGQRIFFVNQRRVFGRRPPPTIVKEVSRNGGATTVVLADIAPGAWDVADTGIHFLPNLRGRPFDQGSAETIMRYDFTDRKVRPAGALRFPVADAWVDRFFIVSRDGRWAMASHVDRFERDIMVLDNFR